MQLLARDGLTDDQVAAILQSSAIEVSAGAHLLNDDLTIREDISDDLVGGTVEWMLHRTIHRTCIIRIARELDWGHALVALHQDIVDVNTGSAARFALGVFVLTSADPVALGETPTMYTAEGYDRLYLLVRPVGDTYETANGTWVGANLDQVVADAGLTGSGLTVDVDVQLEQAAVWPMMSAGGAEPGPTTWLRVLNDITKSVAHRGVWADHTGQYRTARYLEPSARGHEFVFDVDALDTIVGDTRKLIIDRWDRPNRWIFVRSNMPANRVPVDGDGVYRVDNTTGRPDRISVVELEAVGQAHLERRGNAIVADDRRVTTRIELATGPFPPADHADVYLLRDPDLGAAVQVQATAWTQDLTGGDTEWTWEVV